VKFRKNSRANLYAANAKAETRKLALALRDGLGVEARIEKSLVAAQLGASAISVEPGVVISGYYPIKTEIDPRPLMDNLLKRGANLCLPVVIDRDTIIFRQLLPDLELIDTGYGTMGPGPDAPTLDPQIMLMPLSTFDRLGGRIGYGAGYYDQAISRLVERGIGPLKIGVAFDCQQHDLVPQEPHDIAMDAIVTETGYRVFAKE
jgi:5-formyltetrahydrofolate cyclo-ligase